VRKSEKYGVLGSLLSILVFFLTLWMLVLPLAIPKQPEMKGVEIGFGDDGSGDTPDAGGGPDASPTLAPKITPQAPAPAPAQQATVSPKQSKAAVETNPIKQAVVTQKDNSYAIAEQNEKVRLREAQEQLEFQQQEAKKRLAEQQKEKQRQKEQAAISKASAVNGLFGNSNKSNGTGGGSGGGSGNGTGSSNGSGVQGNPAGKGTSGGGNSWSLNGRTLTGKLVPPSYDNDVEGKITVSIRVDESGKVINSSVVSPTTISDAKTRNAAMSAANSTHFSAGTGISTGTITYNFNLR
jgi:TonB family protein